MVRLKALFGTIDLWNDFPANLGVVMLLLLLFAGVVHAAPVQPTVPQAPERPYEHTYHGEVRPDPYMWMRDREDPATINYIEAENDYADEIMKPYDKLQDSVLKEMQSHTKPTDASFPVREGRYLYYYKHKKGADYPTHYRRPIGKLKPETVVLDENELAKGKDYLFIGSLEVSNDGSKVGYTVDTKGDRLTTIYFKDLKTGRMLKDKIEDAGFDLVWDADGKSVFYIKPDKVTLRSRWVYRHVLGHTNDELVYEEKDGRFEMELHRSLTSKYVFIVIESRTTSEVRMIEAAKPSEKPKIFQPRANNVQYSVADGGDRFFVRTNSDAIDFRVMETPLDKTSKENWKAFGPQTPDVYLENLLVQRTHIVRQQRRRGQLELEVIDRANGKSRLIEQSQSDAVVMIADNREYDASSFRFRYESLTTPPTIADYDYATGKQTLRHVQDVPGGFRSSNYVSERVEAISPDGAKVPLSLVYKKNLKRSETTPLLLDAYGAYGDVNETYFERPLLPLLDRGFVYAIAHVRGGADLGQKWYADGKLMKKKNSFHDFIACAEYLIKNKWTSSKHLYIRGESAGGMLVAAVINMRPDLFNGAISKVPFVDVVTTMLDPTIPLTTAEYEEWGNPHEKAVYDYIKSYSPYDNVSKQAYPNLLVRSGLNDTQVGYWEPAKWVARLRKMNTGNNLILFKTELDAGHYGKNGRFSSLEEQAFDSAFMLMLESKTEKTVSRER